MKRLEIMLLLSSLLLSGCRSGAKAAETAVAPSACATSNGIGRLTLLLTPTPVVTEITEALVRLESETERSTVRVNAVLGTTFELRPGIYRLFITLPGYKSAERSATIACGSAQTLNVPMARKR